MYDAHRGERGGVALPTPKYSRWFPLTRPQRFQPCKCICQSPEVLVSLFSALVCISLYNCMSLYLGFHDKGIGFLQLGVSEVLSHLEELGVGGARWEWSFSEYLPAIVE